MGMNEEACQGTVTVFVKMLFVALSDPYIPMFPDVLIGRWLRFGCDRPFFWLLMINSALSMNTPKTMKKVNGTISPEILILQQE